MVEESNTPSPDLEWMLLSQQVSEETILSRLLDGYFDSIFDLAISELTYPQEALRATREIFTKALVGANEYVPDQTVREWLHDITMEVIYDRQGYLADQHLLNPGLISALRKHSPSPSPGVKERDQVEHAILRQLRRQQSAGRKRSTYLEFITVGIIILVFLSILQFGGYLSPSLADLSRREGYDSQPGQISEGQSQGTQKASASLRPGDMYLQRLPPQPPLTLASSHEDIWRRILLSRFTWQSLWADVLVIVHGPEGYIGPPLVERHQVWLEQGAHGIHISSPLAGNELSLEEITPSSRGPGYLSLLHGSDDYSRLGSQVPWFYMSSESIISIPYLANFFFIADYDFPPQRLYFRAVEESTWADRPVLIINATDGAGNLQATLWLDSQTGLALREQFFSADSDSHVRLETTVQKVAYNQRFPADLLGNLTSGGNGIVFASNFQGTPQDQQAQPHPSTWEALSSQVMPPGLRPPQGFDFSMSRLAFVSSSPGTEEGHGQAQFQLYADQYLLGDIFIDDAWHSICARSKSGRQIVISQWSQPPGEPASVVGWYDLADMFPGMAQIPEVIITRLAFSPQAETIAAAGVNQRTGSSRLYLINPDSGESERIRGIDNAWSIAWSPDGSQLATLNLPSFRIYSPRNLRILIYDLESRLIRTLLIEDNFSWGYSAVKIPLDGWTATFPLSMHGLEPCTLPPG